MKSNSLALLLFSRENGKMGNRLALWACHPLFAGESSARMRDWGNADSIAESDLISVSLITSHS